MILGAVEGGGTKFVCGIGTPDGEIIERVSFPTTTPDETLDRVVDYFINKGVQGIGIASFGQIDVNLSSPTYGSITNTPKLNWSDYKILDRVKGHFDIPIGFDNDVNAAAYGISIACAISAVRSPLAWFKRSQT